MLNLSPGTVGYRLVYDASEATPAGWFPAFGLLFVAFSLVFFRAASRGWLGTSGSPNPRSRRLALAFLGFSIVWTLIAGASVFVGHYRARSALRDGSARIVEGPVENFHPMPHSGHDTERFTVQGVAFAYSDYEISDGFNNTSSHGGPIREGLNVRIHYDDSPNPTILRLEIAK